MTEKEFGIGSLLKNRKRYDRKRIALYGTGVNARTVIQILCHQNIIALIDRNHIGEYICGKKIVALEDTLPLHVEVIIIAAEPRSAKAVAERIRSYCMTHNITLLNMYGNDEIKIYEKLIFQDSKYTEMNRDVLMENIRMHDIICFDFMRILYDSRFYSFEEMQKECKEGYPIEDFFADNVICHEQMAKLVHDALYLGKMIYIVSELAYGESVIKGILEKRGMGDVKIISGGTSSLMSGALRLAMGSDFGKKILYIGHPESGGFYMAAAYGFDFCAIKDSWTYMYQLSKMHIKETNIKKARLTIFNEWVLNEFNSPFVCDNYGKKSFLPDSILDDISEYAGKRMDRMEVKDDMDISQCELLEFPQFDEIEVSIIIPVYNHLGYTYHCLKSVLENTVQVKYEIIIADDASTDDTCRLEEAIKGITIIRNEENLFYLKNCNKAARLAKGKYLLFLNNDTRVIYGWLSPMKQILDFNDDVGLVGPKFLNPDGTVQEAGGIIWKDGTGESYGRGKNPGALDLNYVRECDYIMGAAILTRRNLWDEIGGFDERYAPACFEDSDFAFEVRKRGKKVVYQPASLVIHFAGGSGSQSQDGSMRRHLSANICKFADKWKEILEREHKEPGRDIFAARDRKNVRKTILFVSTMIPALDRDAGSKTIIQYIKLFIERNYIVKFIPLDFKEKQPYISELQQLGIEVLYGEGFKEKCSSWIMANQKFIDYAFVHYPEAGEQIVDLLRLTSIQIRYYGHDLRFLRKKREYELTGNEALLHISRVYYEKEKQLVRKTGWVYYPSDIEVEVVKKEFKKEEAGQIPPYIYKRTSDTEYAAENREGIIFIGGSHPPNADAVAWFMEEIYPEVYKQKKLPFYIVGSKFVIDGREGVINLGHITENELEDLYRRVRMAVIPLRYGAGIKGKTVDAMYYGVPIVSTSTGIEGITGAEQYVRVADDAESFRQGILELYDNSDSLERMSEGYKEIIRSQFSPEVAWNKIKDGFQ